MKLTAAITISMVMLSIAAHAQSSGKQTSQPIYIPPGAMYTPPYDMRTLPSGRVQGTTRDGQTWTYDPKTRVYENWSTGQTNIAPPQDKPRR